MAPQPICGLKVTHKLRRITFPNASSQPLAKAIKRLHPLQITIGPGSPSPCSGKKAPPSLAIQLTAPCTAGSLAALIY